MRIGDGRVSTRDQHPEAQADALAARVRGRVGGQKPKLGPRQVKLASEMYEETGDDGQRRYTVAE